ncbi:hypothetical protein BDZ91DRAFT_708785 [Kalaharituber pfeilii]|nr:hypothetical protein BDZ91DRAFT_708785 [Kalaharituber pfeilii]
MSVPLTARSGGNKLFSKHSGASTADEAEYDRLRNLAHAAHRKRNDCFDRSRTAYQSGQKALAHQLSVEGKEHDRAGVEYHKQARDFIFRVNNTQRAEDEIDLHGLYVQEAKDVLSRRIQAEKARHSTGLHV